MIIDKTVLWQTEITPDRSVRCFFLRAFYKDGVEVARTDKPHVILLRPDSDYDAVLADNNADITTRDDMKWPEIGEEEWARAVAHCRVEHTPQVKAAYEVWKTRVAQLAASPPDDDKN